MEFSLTPERQAIRDNVEKVCANYGDDYWLEHDRTGEFPDAFYQAMAEGGWLGITLPEAYGGSGLGVIEAAVMMHAVAGSPGAMSAASAIHIHIFGANPIVVFGAEEQKARWLPDLAQGKIRPCFAVTEPDAGLDTGNIKTKAERTNKGYVVHGKKIWTSTARQADKIMLLARTTAREDCKRPTDGLSLFYTNLDRDYCDVREIDKMGRKAVDSNEIFIDGLPIALDERIGEEGKGFKYLLHSLNPERIVIGIEAVGIGQNALARATQYAKDRVVFGRPIGQNQAVQHPLAKNWMELRAAYLMAMYAAQLYDSGEPCGPEANAAKYLGAEAGFAACTQAVMTHGGMGYAKEFHVERLMREVMITRIAPVSPALILCHIAEKVLGLPKSY